MLIAKEEKSICFENLQFEKAGGKVSFFFVNSGKILLELYSFFLRSRQDWVSHWPE